jgi:predicted kinase
MQVTIMRSISGGGKTTYINKNFGGQNPLIVSADNYFMKDGKYIFDPSKLGEAHDWCWNEYLKGLLANTRDIIIDNTNISTWEVALYYRPAQVFKAEVKIIRIYCDPIVAFNRNIHKVPLKTVLDMHQRLMMETLPPWWKEEVILA